MQRPTGVTIIAVLAALGGLFAILAGLTLVGLGGLAGAAAGGGYAALLGVLFLIYGVLALILAYGFWTLKSWAWPLGVGVEIFGIVSATLQFLNDTSQVVSLVISLAIAAVIIWYLFQPHVKAAFGRA